MTYSKFLSSEIRVQLLLPGSHRSCLIGHSWLNQVDWGPILLSFSCCTLELELTKNWIVFLGIRTTYSTSAQSNFSSWTFYSIWCWQFRCFLSKKKKLRRKRCSSSGMSNLENSSILTNYFMLPNSCKCVRKLITLTLGNFGNLFSGRGLAISSKISFRTGTGQSHD